MAAWILCPLPILFCAAELAVRYGRYRSLSRMKLLFSELRSVLCTAALPAEELFGEIVLRGVSETEAAVVADSLCEGNDFVESWEKMLTMHPFLSRNDRILLARYAGMFGGSNIGEQIRLCERYLDTLQTRCAEEKQKLSDGRRLYLTVGAAGSALVLIMMK